MDKKGVKDVCAQKAQIKLGRNHQILSMKFKKNSVTLEQRNCAKLKSDRKCSRSPRSGRSDQSDSDRSDCFIIKHSKSGTPTKEQLYSVSDQLQAQNDVKMASKFISKLYNDS